MNEIRMSSEEIRSNQFHKQVSAQALRPLPVEHLSMPWEQGEVSGPAAQWVRLGKEGAVDTQARDRSHENMEPNVRTLDFSSLDFVCIKTPKYVLI